MKSYLSVFGLLALFLSNIAHAGVEGPLVSASALGSLGWSAILGLVLVIAALATKYFKK